MSPRKDAFFIGLRPLNFLKSDRPRRFVRLTEANSRQLHVNIGR